MECIQLRPGELECNGTRHFSGDYLRTSQICEGLFLEKADTRPFWVHVACAICCICTAALAAGLTLGLTSIDEFGLQVLCNRLPEEVEPEATPEVREQAQTKLLKDQQCARMIIPVISGHYFHGRRRQCGCVPAAMNPSNEHYLLVTLLLCNAAANEALPLFLDRLVPGWVAVILSVTVVLIFGEIIPSALFTGKNQLPLAAAFSPLVRVVKLLMLPIAWPMSLFLDKALGHEVDEHRREDIKALVRTMKRECLELEEMNMIQGVLELHHKTADVVASPLQEAKMLAHDEVVDEACINNVLHWGHSRLLVFRRDPSSPERRDDIMGVILVKKLLGINLNPAPQAGSLLHALKEPVVLSKDENLLCAFEKFREKCCHLAVVGGKPEVISKFLQEKMPIPPDARPTLFCSLEDVLEEMLKEEIYDEDDVERRELSPPVSSRTSTRRRTRHGTGTLLQQFASRHLGTPIRSRRTPIAQDEEMDQSATEESSGSESSC